MPAKKRRNPFYVLLVPVGVAFVVTAFAYGFMAFQAVQRRAGGRGGAPRAAHPLFQWLRAHGDAAPADRAGGAGRAHSGGDRHRPLVGRPPSATTNRTLNPLSQGI